MQLTVYLVVLGDCADNVNSGVCMHLFIRFMISQKYFGDYK